MVSQGKRKEQLGTGDEEGGGAGNETRARAGRGVKKVAAGIEKGRWQ